MRTRLSGQETHYERRRRAVHQRILAAAVERFEDAGIDGTKVAEICAVAGVAQKTFFNHFPTKRHVVREIAELFLAQMLAAIEETRHLEGPLAARLVQLFERIAVEAEATSPTRRMLVIEVIRLLHGGPDQTRLEQAFRKPFESLLRAGVQSGEVTRAHPVSVVTQVMAGSLYALIFDWASIDGFPVRVRARATAKFLVDALAPRSGPRRPGGRRQVAANND